MDPDDVEDAEPYEVPVDPMDLLRCESCE